MKWHFPVGLLYDLYSGASEQLRDEQSNEGNSGAYTSAEEPGITKGPRAWKLTLHFEDWPKESLAQLDGEGKIMRDAFTNSVKEVGMPS
jgi:autophagy-related protein 5